MMQDWKNPRMIFQLSTVLVTGRDHINKEQLDRQQKFLEITYGARILSFDMPSIGISSAEIRKRITENKTIRYYVSNEVMEYIKENRLYWQ
jgi:nicotinate-nucleotide adenylyltransferase